MGRINKFVILKFEFGNDKKYRVEAIQDNAVYAKKIDGHLLGLYYLIAWKSYLEKKNTWKSFLAVIYL